MRQKNSLSLVVQYPDPRPRDMVPRAQVRRWVQAALLAPAELTIRFVDADEGRVLNRDYRGKDYATNVLTFAYTEDDDSAVTQADIILCTDVLQREAAEQHKTLVEHAAHLVVHGVLHAQGYDHETDAEAAEMEQLEIDILTRLGVQNPYRSRN
ncbi:MAG TPA: rRNA maturation RNase YbeY [Oxalobacteraceae bacterium]|jgi:probable rRNA maturation factor|nr:rRNA maturation RNase YbeY [Oxalobacteraceae bacterium]